MGVAAKRSEGICDKSLIALIPTASETPSDAAEAKSFWFPAIADPRINSDIMVALADAKNKAQACFRSSVGVSVKCGVEGDALFFRQHSVPLHRHF